MKNAIVSGTQTAVSRKEGHQGAPFWLVLTAYCLVRTAGLVDAADRGDVAPAPQAPAAQPAAAAKSINPEEQLRAQLDGTQWAIQLTPTSGSKEAKPKEDSVSFTAKQVTSDFLSKAGYPSSNYSLSIGDDGRGVWETMQTKEGEGVAFWRGELEGTRMFGVLSKHPLEGDPEDYSFSGQLTTEKAIAIPAPAKPAAVQAQPAAPSPATAAPARPKTPAKKKRGWF